MVSNLLCLWVPLRVRRCLHYNRLSWLLRDIIIWSFCVYLTPMHQNTRKCSLSNWVSNISRVCLYWTVDKIASTSRFQIEKGAVILIPFASELGFLSRPLGAMLIHPQSSICPARSRSNPSDKWSGNQAGRLRVMEAGHW